MADKNEKIVKSVGKIIFTDMAMLLVVVPHTQIRNVVEIYT